MTPVHVQAAMKSPIVARKKAAICWKIENKKFCPGH